MESDDFKIGSALISDTLHIADSLNALIVGGSNNDKNQIDPIESATVGKSGAIKYKSNHDLPVRKDEIVKKLMPDVVPECIIGKSGHCVSEHTAYKIASVLSIGGSTQKQKPSSMDIIQAAKEKLQCDTEMCILEALEPQIGSNIVRAEISSSFKVKGGPTDNKLLSNVNIDKVMQVYAKKFPGFYPFNFNMRNYASYSFVNGRTISSPDSLATIQFMDLFTGLHDGTKYNCAGCIINTDVYQGEGKHWMALFADARGVPDTWTIEFFNSAGNRPTPEWVNWQVKTKNQMIDLINSESSGYNKQPRILDVCHIRHQQSMTECGLYSLFYIYARLHQVPPEYFVKTPIPDQLMFEFRQNIFGGERGITDGKFDWETYKNQVSVKWE